jgi:hypothetical protein
MLPVIDPQVLFEIRRVTTASKLERFRRAGAGRGAGPGQLGRACIRPRRADATPNTLLLYQRERTGG